jgi:hypothetical protein
MLWRQPRDFQQEARRAVANLQPSLKIDQEEHIPQAGPCLLTPNHYTRSGLPAWWFVLAISAAVPVPIHWVVTSAWTFQDRPRLRSLEPLTRWAFQRMAQVYGFVTMPPMPPRPQEVAARARAVRQTLALARQPNAVIGLAPEGRDSGSGLLLLPPEGVGRFALHLAGLGLRVRPVGVFEEKDRLCLRFGPAYALLAPPGLSAQERDRCASNILMDRIAALLPAHLHGDSL